MFTNALLLVSLCSYLAFFGANGAISDQCLGCICKVESNCQSLDCKMDSGSLSCGYFQIKKPYYIDCGQPDKKPNESTDAAWRRCSKNYACAKQCVNKYMERYASRCQSNPTCEVHSRVHNGGPLGCKSRSTIGYWNKVNSCLRG